MVYAPGTVYCYVELVLGLGLRLVLLRRVSPRMPCGLCCDVIPVRTIICEVYHPLETGVTLTKKFFMGSIAVAAAVLILYSSSTCVVLFLVCKMLERRSPATPPLPPLQVG